MKAACIQMDIRHCKKQTNIDHALSMAKEALAEGAELIVLPEVFSTGFCYDNIEKNAECAPYPIIETLREFSKNNDCILIGSIIEAAEDGKTAALHDISYYNPPVRPGEVILLRRGHNLTNPVGKERPHHRT
jgi:predicted amidohydrolase